MSLLALKRRRLLRGGTQVWDQTSSGLETNGPIKSSKDIRKLNKREEKLIVPFGGSENTTSNR